VTEWTRFWFQPAPVSRLRTIRRTLCVLTALYFVAALPDVPTWFSADAPASSQRLGDFFRAADLTDDAAWMLSPLFAWDAAFAGTSLSQSPLVYRLYLIVGIVSAGWAAGSDELARRTSSPRLQRLLQSSVPMILLWLWFVGWANRVVLLAGIVEPLLSVSLAAVAVAPLGCAGDVGAVHWRSRLSERLLGVQATLLALTTTATMLASATWWNGTGAYALVAPVEDRFFDVRGTFFEIALVYELVNFLLVASLPVGVVLAWRDNTRKTGIAMIIAWSAVVGLLSANVLYAATFAVIATKIGNEDIDGASTSTLAARGRAADDQSIAGAA
jgi:hypothetical protein